LADEQHMTAASPSDVATGFLLDAIPVPIWSEDFSAVAEWLDGLRGDDLHDISTLLLSDYDLARVGIGKIRIKSANQAVAELLGVDDPAVLVGSLQPDLITDEAVPGFIHQMQVMWEGKSQLKTEIDGVNAAGQRRHFFLNWTSATDSQGRPDYSDVIVTLTDITAQRNETQRLSDEASLLAAIQDVSTRISAELDLDHLLEQIANEASWVLGADSAAVFLVDHATSSITRAVGSETAPDAVGQHTYRELEEGISGWVWRHGEATVSSNIRTDSRNSGQARLRADQASGVESIAVAPLIIEEAVVGTLTVAATPEAPPFTESHRKYLQIIATHGAVAIHNSQLYDASVKARAELAETLDVLQRTQASLLAAQKLESIGSLAAGIAHEINTPMQYIGDNLTFIRDSIADLEEVVEVARQVGQGSTLGDLENAIEEADLEMVLEEAPLATAQALEGVVRVRDIVRALKDFSHPGSETFEPVDINRAIETTLTVARNEYKHLAEVTTELDPDLPLTHAIAGPLNQAILNIVVNAAHAIGDVVEGTGQLGTIRISTTVDGPHTVIRIADTGGGIPEELHQRVFDPFFTTKEIGKGTGQGLAIARSAIVDQHGGVLDFTVEPGVGTTFELRLLTSRSD
jgi:signal transduction histidine kinase